MIASRPSFNALARKIECGGEVPVARPRNIKEAIECFRKGETFTAAAGFHTLVANPRTSGSWRCSIAVYMEAPGVGFIIGRRELSTEAEVLAWLKEWWPKL